MVDGGDVALLAEPVHVDFVSGRDGHGIDIRSKPRKAKVNVAVGEMLGKLLDAVRASRPRRRSRLWRHSPSYHCDAGAAI